MKYATEKHTLYNQWQEPTQCLTVNLSHGSYRTSFIVQRSSFSVNAFDTLLAVIKQNTCNFKCETMDAIIKYDYKAGLFSVHKILDDSRHMEDLELDGISLEFDLKLQDGGLKATVVDLVAHIAGTLAYTASETRLYNQLAGRIIIKHKV